MNIDDINDRIEKIRNIADRPEHIALDMERALWFTVLCAIADNECDDPQAVAGAAVASVFITTPTSNTAVGEI